MPSKPPGVSTILQAVDRRGDTDERPAFFTHVVLPILLVLIGLGIAAILLLATVGYQGTIEATIELASPTVVGGAVVVTAVALVVAAVLAVIGAYRVMRRRDRHLARDHVLRQGLIDYARWLANKNPDTRAREHVEAMTRIHDDARIDEYDRPAAIHMMLIVLFPLWYLYVVYYLTKDLPAHARRQARFLRETHNVLDEAGLEVPEVEAAVTVNERSYLLTLLLVLIVPFGNLVVLYWLYNDPEEHFDQQWSQEDALVNLVSEEEAAEGALEQPSEETDAPDAPDVEPSAPAAEGQAPGEPEARPDAEEQAAPETEAEFTVWTCPECQSRYKVPPKRPVRVTCKECEHQEVLEE